MAIWITVSHVTASSFPTDNIIIPTSKNASVYKPLDWSNSYHVIIKNRHSFKN